jgi:hypothetical protein
LVWFAVSTASIQQGVAVTLYNDKIAHAEA